jgi:small subunit ribosomal protein S16
MATRIRLRRTGRKHQATYRIVVTDKAAPRDGRFIETLGHYNPRTEPATLEVNADKARDWLSRGATPSETVRSLFKKAGVFSAAGSTPTEATASAPETEAPASAPDAEAAAEAPAEAKAPEE